MHRSLFWEPLLLQAFLCFCGSPTPRFAGSSEFDQDKMHQPRSTLTGGRCGCGLIRHYCQFGPPETRIFIKSCCMQFLSEEKTAYVMFIIMGNQCRLLPNRSTRPGENQVPHRPLCSIVGRIFCRQACFPPLPHIASGGVL